MKSSRPVEESTMTPICNKVRFHPQYTEGMIHYSSIISWVVRDYKHALRSQFRERNFVTHDLERLYGVGVYYINVD